MRVLLYLGIISCIVLSCSDPVVHPDPDRGFDYFPLSEGAEWTYKVDSIIFDDGNSINILDTVSGFVMEKVTGKAVNLEGDTVYTIERRHRTSTTDPWITTHVWTAARDYYSALRNEENVTLVKMQFPLHDTAKWDPVKFVSPDTEVLVGTEVIEMYAYWEGRVVALDHSGSVGDLTFPEMMTCLQADDENALERRYVFEQYARDVGLVMRVDTILDSYCKRIGQIEPCLGLSWMEKAEKGYILVQELINYK